jgi:hypothetical protein
MEQLGLACRSMTRVHMVDVKGGGTEPGVVQGRSPSGIDESQRDNDDVHEKGVCVGCGRRRETVRCKW